MTHLKRTVRGTMLAVAAGGASLAAPVSAGGNGYWHTPAAAPACNCRDCRDSGEPSVFDEWSARLQRKKERFRKQPFDHYAHNPDDLQARPICPPYCSPHAGYYEPGWRQLSPPPGMMSTGYLEPVPVPSSGHGTLVPPPAPPSPPSGNRSNLPPAAPPPAPPTAAPAVSQAAPARAANGGPRLATPGDVWSEHDPAF